MTKKNEILTLRRASLVAGLGFFVILILFIFNNFLVIGGLVEPGDGVKTASNIADNQLLFRSGIAAFMVLTMADIVVAWGLYIFQRPVNQALSLISAMFRLVATAVLAAAIINLVNIGHLVDSGASPSQIGDQVGLFANAFMQGWQIALVFYGVHLFLIGYMALRSHYMPKWLGVLVSIAGIGYVFDSLTSAFTSGEAPLVANVTFVGEVLLIFWLLLKGSKLSTKGN